MRVSGGMPNITKPGAMSPVRGDGDLKLSPWDKVIFTETGIIGRVLEIHYRVDNGISSTKYRIGFKDGTDREIVHYLNGSQWFNGEDAFIKLENSVDFILGE